jgi:hypothetical protein
MRVALILAVVLGLAASAAAQSHASGVSEHVPRPSTGLPLPHIGLPLPTLGLPLPQMGLPPETPVRSEPLKRPGRLEQPGRLERSRRLGAGVVFFPAYGWPYLPGAAYPEPPLTALPPTGRLLLTLRSGTDPQIFVDGYYEGLFTDVAGQLTLDVGAHMIELREEGYETVHIPVRIPLDDVINYDVNLKPIEAPLSSLQPVAAQDVPPATTIYVIPGCYIGNVPPKDARLPIGCDASRALAFPSR